MPKATLKPYIDGLTDQFRQVLEDNEGEILNAINRSEGRDVKLPGFIYICDAPGTQHVDVEVALTTKKKVFKGHMDIEPPEQGRLEAVVEEAKKESPGAKQKSKAAKAKAEKKLAKHDKDKPE